MDVMEAKNGGKRAKAQFMLEYQGLVKSVAIKYNSERNFDLDDLISEGNLGLLRAIDEFDVSRGFKFSTYAVYWIKKMIRTYVMNESKSVYINSRGHDNLRKFHRSLMELTNKLNREPSLEEISEYIGISLDDLKALIESQYKFPSIDAIFEANNNVITHSLYDNGSDNPMDLYEDYEMIYEIRNLVLESNELTEKQYQVLVLKYGLLDGNCRSLEDIGAMLNITRQRAYQHEQAALLKLRKSERLKKLEGYGKIK